MIKVAKDESSGDSGGSGGGGGGTGTGAGAGSSIIVDPAASTSVVVGGDSGSSGSGGGGGATTSGGGGSSGGPGGGHSGTSYTYTPPTTSYSPGSPDAAAAASYTGTNESHTESKVAEAAATGDYSGGFNMGGRVGGYNYGGAIPGQHPGKPMGTDTVPAWLTEGEYVIDKDSVMAPLPAHIRNQLAQARTGQEAAQILNSYEPNSGVAGQTAMHSDRINNEAMMREKFYNRGGKVAYRQLGGPAVGGFDAQRQAAQRAKFANQRGALQSSGLAASGQVRQNQAGLITQAGLGNRAFTPQAGALDTVGRGLQQSQQAEATYQGELGRIAEAERAAKEAERRRLEDMAREDKLREEGKDASKAEAEAKLESAKQESLRMLMDAKFLASKAGKAGDIVNRHVSIDDDETQGLLDKLQGGIATAISAGTEIFGATSERDKLLIAYANQKYPGSYDAYVRLATLAKNLVKPLIASGILGRTSDGDIRFAEQTIFDPTQPSNTWLSQLNDAIARVKGISISRDESVPVNATAQENVFNKGAVTASANANQSAYEEAAYGGSNSSSFGNTASDVIGKGWKLITGG